MEDITDKIKHDSTIRITLDRYEELSMLLNKNRIQEAKIIELLKEIKSLKRKL